MTFVTHASVEHVICFSFEHDISCTSSSICRNRQTYLVIDRMTQRLTARGFLETGSEGDACCDDLSLTEYGRNISKCHRHCWTTLSLTLNCTTQSCTLYFPRSRDHSQKNRKVSRNKQKQRQCVMNHHQVPYRLTRATGTIGLAC